MSLDHTRSVESKSEEAKERNRKEAAGILKAELLEMKGADTGLDDLKLKYIDSQSQNKSLQDKLSEAETKLKNLQEVLEPAVEEFDQLQRKYDIEQCCRSQAETYASKLRKENTVLKRQSQLLITKLQPTAADLSELIAMESSENNLEEVEEEEEEEQGDKTIENLKAQNKQTEKKEKAMGTKTTEEETTSNRNEHHTSIIRDLEAKLEKSQQREKFLDEELKKFSQVSHLVWQECRDAKERFDKESRLKYEAERFAHQMLSERDAVIRQSSILLASASSDRRLVEALATIEDLTKALEMERLARQKEVKELEENLKVMESESKRMVIEDLEGKLQIAVEESDRLLKTTQDMEEKLNQLEDDNEILRGKLRICEARLQPPSPPPPPSNTTTSRFNPLRFFAKKSNKGSVKAKEEASRNKNYEDAIKEMMDRIKTGHALKAAKPSQNESESVEVNQSMAMNDLQKMLLSLKSPQTKSLPSEKETPPPSPSPSVEETLSSKRLLRRLQPLPATPDEAAGAKDLKANTTRKNNKMEK